MNYAQKLIYQSNYWYNDGLKKAKIHDLSGAQASLRRSLQYNRENVAARNLLGLVYYGKGEVAEALVEWIISKNFKSHENIANYYIKKVQEASSELDVINQAVRKYNQCLAYCEQNGEDLAIIQLKKVIAAHPTFLKAYQLLALLYLHTEQYPKARQVLRRAHKIDTTNDITLHYMHEVQQVNKQKLGSLKEEKEQTVTYKLGNETIIQPASGSLKDNAGTLTIINILIGIVVGAAVVWFLVMPSVTKNKSVRTNKEIIAYSDQLAAKDAETSALKKELEGFRSKSEETANAKETADSTQTSYEALMKVVSQYNSNNYSNETMAEGLVDVNPEALGEKGKSEYDRLKGELFPKVCSAKYQTATENMAVLNYSTAITNLEFVISLDEKYEDGKALMLLADAYTEKKDAEKAKETYEKIIELFPDSKIAKEAQDKLSGKKPKKSADDGSGDASGGTGGDGSGDVSGNGME